MQESPRRILDALVEDLSRLVFVVPIDVHARLACSGRNQLPFGA